MADTDTISVEVPQSTPDLEEQGQTVIAETERTIDQINHERIANLESAMQDIHGRLDALASDITTAASTVPEHTHEENVTHEQMEARLREDRAVIEPPEPPPGPVAEIAPPEGPTTEEEPTEMHDGRGRLKFKW